ncbi:MAG: hypothetical protein E7354_04230 [Clostridiales bacterium]|nr:hypothetical protein [Clostridiales bacterium]
MEKETCFSRLKKYIKEKLSIGENYVDEEMQADATVANDPIKDMMDPIKSANGPLRANTDNLPPPYYIDPLYLMNVGSPMYSMDIMERYDRMMMASGMYDPELENEEYMF